MRTVPRTRSCGLVISATATLLMVLGCFRFLMSSYREDQSKWIYYGLRLVDVKPHQLRQPPLQEQQPRLEHQQQDQPYLHQGLALYKGDRSSASASAAGQGNEASAAVIDPAFGRTTFSVRGEYPPLYSRRMLKTSRYDVGAGASHSSQIPTTNTKQSGGVNYVELELLIEALSSSRGAALPLRLPPWRVCDPPLFRPPSLVDAVSSAGSSSLPPAPSAPHPEYHLAGSLKSSSFTATDSGIDRPPSSYVFAVHGEAEPSLPPPPLLQYSRPVAAIAAIPSPRLPAFMASSLSIPRPTLQEVPCTTFVRKWRTNPKTVFKVMQQHQPQRDRQDKQHGGYEQANPQEGVACAYVSTRQERAPLPSDASSPALTSPTTSSRLRSGPVSRRLTLADTLIRMGSQFIMYPSMATMLEEQLGTLKRAFQGEPTADLKIPVYLSPDNNCLVAFDFIADQDNGDNFHLGRVSPKEIQISISFAEHQGLLKYTERRVDTMQIAKLPTVHVQRFELPKNCLSTSNASWTAYCTAPAPKTCYVGRVDLHLSTLGDEDELTFVAPIPFSSYIEAQLKDGVTYSEVLDRVEAPTPLLRMLFDDFRCLLHFRFHTEEPTSTLFFWLKNRQGVRIDVKDATTNTMNAKKTSIPPLCGAEQSEDIVATWTELPDGSYKALVMFRKYFEYRKDYEGFVMIERKEPDKRPEEAFDYFNENQLEFDRFFTKENLIPLSHLPRVIEKK